MPVTTLSSEHRPSDPRPQKTAGATPAHLGSPELPHPRGPLSTAVVTALRGNDVHNTARKLTEAAIDASEVDPIGADAQLTLQICYELHYRGFTGVDERWEWSPDLLRLRAEVEDRFVSWLRARVGTPHLEDVLADLCTEPIEGDGLSHYLADAGTWEQMREFFVHRSIYHLKEADPHAWVIPRLQGQAKASLVAVEFDEYGGGHAERMHSHLFAELLGAAGLNTGYLAYLDKVPAESMATVNLMSMLGLHRRHRGALVGLFAAAEITTAPSAARIDLALDRMGAPEACRYFFTEHIEADAVHEQVLRRDVIADMLSREPWLEDDVTFGVLAGELLEERFAARLLRSWGEGASSLL